MDKRMLTILLAVVLIGCFFLAYLKPNLSGYDAVFNTPGGEGSWEKYVWLLIPLSGLLLLIGALNRGNYVLGRSLWTWLPLLTIIFIIVRLYMETKAGFSDMARVFGIGFWITLGAAVILAFYQPRRI
jgi:hypothetical protein